MKRDLSNKKVSVWIGLANSVANMDAPTIAEIKNMLFASDAIRWDGFDFGAQEAESIDDRSLSDDAGATIAGFLQFGGAIPFFAPLRTDTSSVLRKAFDLLKAPRQEYIIVERVGFKSTSEPIAEGDNVNTYRIMGDSFSWDTEGDGGVAYLVGFLPRGDTSPWTIVPAAAPASVAIVGGAALALTVGAVGLRGADYLGNHIARRATWASSDQSIATVEAGIIVGRKAGTANITATFPGATTSTPVAVTVAAA